jgi:hypothetical protein
LALTLLCKKKAVTIDKGADCNREEVYGWKASSRNLKHLKELSRAKSSRNQDTNTTHATQHNTTQRSIKVRSVRSRQHRPPGSLGEQQRTGAVHTTLTLHKSYTQFPVGTSKERSAGDSWRACRRDVAEGTKDPHDGPAEVPVRFDAGRHEGVARVQMTGMRPVLIPVTQGGSSASCLAGGGNVGCAARMNHGDIQQGGTMGRRKGHLDVSTCVQPRQRLRKCNWAPYVRCSPRGL